jgi:hypothetical protein
MAKLEALDEDRDIDRGTAARAMRVAPRRLERELVARVRPDRSRKSARGISPHRDT